MLLQSALLFFSAFLGGMLLLAIPRLNPAIFKLSLVFAGSYLFSITIVHLLPELFSCNPLNNYIGFYILIGFFLQLLLGFFSKGVEHGHMYASQQGGPNLAPAGLFTSLCIHAFLDGIILTNAISGQLHHHHHTIYSLLLGIILHKACEGFALVSVLSGLVAKKKIVIVYLFFFSLASPLGLLMSQYCSQQLLLTQQGFIALAGIAGGNFLHIATTIFYEHSTNHRMNAQTLVATLSGVGLVIVLTYLL